MRTRSARNLPAAFRRWCRSASSWRSTIFFIEGLIHISELGSDHFHFDETRHELLGSEAAPRIAFRPGAGAVGEVDLRDHQDRLPPHRRDATGHPAQWQDRAGPWRGDRTARCRASREACGRRAAAPAQPPPGSPPRPARDHHRQGLDHEVQRQQRRFAKPAAAAKPARARARPVLSNQQDQQEPKNG